MYKKFFEKRESTTRGGGTPDTNVWRVESGRKGDLGDETTRALGRPRVGFALFLCFLRARVRHFSACSLPTECRNGTSLSRPVVQALFPFSRVCNEGEKRTNKARKEQGEGEVAYIDVGTRVTRMTWRCLHCLSCEGWKEKKKKKERKKEKKKRKGRENAGALEPRSTDWNLRGSM